VADEQDKQGIRDQANRIFQHGLYEDSALTERSNYYFIAESMLVVAYTGLISSASAAVQQASTIWIARILAFFGLLLTMVWIYANRRQWYVIQHLRKRLLELVPEYKETYETRCKWRISCTNVDWCNVGDFHFYSVMMSWAIESVCEFKAIFLKRGAG